MKLDCSFHVFLFPNRQVTEIFVCNTSATQEFAWRYWVPLGFMWLAGNGGPNVTLYLPEKVLSHIPGFGISNSLTGPARMARISLWPLEFQIIAPASFAFATSRQLTPLWQPYSDDHELTQGEGLFRGGLSSLTQKQRVRTPKTQVQSESRLNPQAAWCCSPAASGIHPSPPDQQQVGSGGPFPLPPTSYCMNEINSMIQGTYKCWDDVFGVFLIPQTIWAQWLMDVGNRWDCCWRLTPSGPQLRCLKSQ